ncbi:hypothetical protein [Streptomyces sp. CNZ748]|uniref:hypothetical protein n=1 Tax=Streptomyces sp. CNZ748 TaxID=2885160 RepID=UPI001E4D8057|nr:hypothetical protein [Streptomyces sp. CNZ748]
MTGGQRYWNEDTQRWEDVVGVTAPATPPPPPRPEFLPPAPDAGPRGVPDPDAPTGVLPAPPAEGWSVPGPPRPAARPLAGRRLVWGVLGGAAAAGVAVALVLTSVLGDDGADGRADDRAGGAVDTQAPPAADEEAPGPTDVGTNGAELPSDTPSSPSGETPELPEGYELHEDPEGFTIARPTGWERESVASQHGMDVVNYRAPDGFRRLQVYEIAEPSPQESFEVFLSDGTPKAEGFEKVALLPVETGETSGMRLEYRADSLRGEPEVGSWHIQDVRFRAPGDGKVYAIAAYGAPTDGIDPELDLALTALAHFCPPSTTCAPE